MEDKRKLNSSLESAAWGALFIWWGITELVSSLPTGMGAMGIGAILVALNVARAASGLRASGFSTTLGILALILGGLELITSALHLPLELPVFAILLIALGVILLVPALGGLRARHPAQSE
jgi:hypothetical protein